MPDRDLIAELAAERARLAELKRWAEDLRRALNGVTHD